MGCPTYLLASWLFLRLLGLIYLFAFVSLATQIKGLAGSRGILPAAEHLQSWPQSGLRRFYRVPTLCWWNCSDGFLVSLSWSGAVLAILLAVGVGPLPVLALLWIFYLSLFKVCRAFLGYQWDVLLLETGFLAIFLAPLEMAPRWPPVTEPPVIVRWLFWWLLFRLMFSSGLIKLRSGDRTWRNLTALRHHYETQPLPTAAAWQMHQLPARFHQFSAVFMFVVELFAPFLLLGPPSCRHLAAILFITLMALIQISGNYCFFNLLGIALSILLLDDQALVPVWDRIFGCDPLATLVTEEGPRFPDWVYLPLAGLVLMLSIELIGRLARFDFHWPGQLGRWSDLLEPFQLVNSYGLFAVITTQRPEIIVEGSYDGVIWQAYEFKWKPGEPKRAPRFVAPHQPRLDWQMWFAALGYYHNHPWFGRFLERLLEGSAPVLALLQNNPFAERPPKYVRAIVYDYRFTTRAQRRATGAWWQRERRGVYCPTIQRSSTG